MRQKNFDIRAVNQAALNLFWEKGYQQTSMEDLLSATKLSRSSFYNTFGDKRSLYESILKSFGDMGAAACSTLTLDKKPSEAIRDFFELTFFLNVPSLNRGCLLVNTVLEQQGNDVELAEQAAEQLARVEQHFQEYFQQARESRLLSDTLNPEQMAAYLMTIIKGMRVAAREGKSIEDLKQILAVTITLIEAHHD